MKSNICKIFLAVFVLATASGLDAKTSVNGGYKIHGDGYRCGSYEDAGGAISQSDALTYGKLALSAYQDADTADAKGSISAYEGTGYVPLTKSETKELLSGSGLTVGGSDSNPTVSGDNTTLLNAIILKKCDGSGKPVEYVISYRGSKELGDWVDDAKQVADKVGVLPQQYKDAAALFSSVLSATSGTDTKLSCTGHSLGGGLVTYVMSSVDYGDRDVKGYTYNAAGLSEKTMEGLTNVGNASKDIVNVRNQLDPVSYVAYHVGEMYEVTTSAAGTRHTVKGDHGLEGLLDNMLAANSGEGSSPSVVDDISRQLAQLELQAISVENAISAAGLSSQESQSALLAEIERVTRDGGISLDDLTLDDVAIGSATEKSASDDAILAKWQSQIDGLKATLGTDEDKNLLQKAADLVKEKVKEGIEKGEGWINNGGIRDLLKKELGKALEGKVPSEDKARMLNLADALCNVGKDGGTSFAKALGSDGKDLLRSLAVAELAKQISAALPKDVADNVNKYLDMVLADGIDMMDPAARQQLVDTVKAGISECLPYKNSADAVNRLVQDVFDGKSVDVIDAASSLGTSLGIDALKDAISRTLGDEAAAKVNALIDAYTKDGAVGLTESALKEVNALIDKYAPGDSSAAALKKTVDGIVKGTATAGDIKSTVTELVGGYAEKIIDESGLDASAKKAAKEAVAELKKNGMSQLTQTAQDFIQNYVADKLGEDAGKAAGDLFHAIVTPSEDVWTALEKDIPVIGKAIGSKILAKVESYAAKQIDKFIAKHPVLQKMFGIVGLDGSSIVNGLKNIWGIFAGKGSLADKFKELGKRLVEDLKQIALRLLKWGLSKLTGWLNNLANKVLDKIIAWLGKLINNTDSSLIRKGLEWLKSQAESCKKKGAITTLTNTVNQKAYDWVKKRMTPAAQGGAKYEGVFYRNGGDTQSQGGAGNGPKK